MSDMTDTIAPKSDQLDAVDLLGGPRTFTIDGTTVKPGGDQPVSIRLREFDRVWRPSKNMRRVLVAAWGSDSAAYTGQRVTLYCDPDVMFGDKKVGGTRISHMTGIAKPLSVVVLAKRGQSATITVQPLKETAPPPAPTGPSMDDLLAAFDAAGVAKEQRLAYCANVAGRDLTSAKDLSADEAAKVLEALTTDATTLFEGGADQ